MTGVVCRLLYLQALWKLKSTNATSHSPEYHLGEDTEQSSVYITVYAASSDYPKFTEHVAEACKLMDFNIIVDRQEAPQADIIFLYIPPSLEDITDDQYKTIEEILDLCEEFSSPKEGSQRTLQTPTLCILTGDSELLPIETNEECNRGRDLAELAITQRLNPILEGRGYESAALFAVEFLRSTHPQNEHDPNTEASKNLNHFQLETLMTRFGCSSSNLMHHNEKWKIYVHKDSVVSSYLAQDNRSGEAVENDDEQAYWEQISKSKACDSCHSIQTNLLRCTGCRNAVYCSQSCQKEAWKFHKHTCKQNLGNQLRIA
ncbi:hypothetical protein ABG067_001194 [Albugo candida]